VADFLAGTFATAGACRVRAPSYRAFVSLDCYSAHWKSRIRNLIGSYSNYYHLGMDLRA